MTRPNAFEADLSDRYSDDDPDGYRVAETPFGKAAGGKDLEVRLFELPPGQRVCPYHYEYVEEWLLVMTGEVEVRTPARVVMFSAATVPAIAVYPDSDKVGVWTANERDQWMFRGHEPKLEYFDGELPATN
jgi:hypothetical protein